MDYIIISDSSCMPTKTIYMEREVSQKLTEGYQPCGNITVVPEFNPKTSETHYHFYQAMIKKD